MAISSQPRIVLGLMQFAPDENRGGRITSLSEFKAALDMYQSRGYSEVDTARVYGGGTQEAWSRQAGWKDRGLSLATKFYPLPAGNHGPEALMRQFESSLEQLGTDCIDVVYLHGADRSVPFAETLEILNSLHQAGKFKQLGLSNITAFEIAEIVMTCKYNNWIRPTVYQGCYNVLQRGIEDEVIPACHRYGIDVLAYGLTVGGLLTGSIPDKDTIPAEGRYSNKVMGGMARPFYFRDSMFEAIKVAKEAVDKYALSLVEVGLRWLVHHSKLNIKDGGNDGFVVGVSSLDQLQGNMDALQNGGPLPADVLEALDKACNIDKPFTPPYYHHELKYGYDTKKILFGFASN